MLNLARSILRDPYTAEDVVQDVFVKIAAKHIERIEQMNSNVEIKNYLLKATKNTALNVLLKKHNETISLDDVPLSLTSLSNDGFVERICDEAEYNYVLETICDLKEPYRSALHYHFVLELSIEETANCLNRTPSAVKKQLVRGKEKLLLMLKNSKNGVKK
jgi:RNA polymerase sigma-70 factor (ECF subfamily)